MLAIPAGEGARGSENYAIPGLRSQVSGRMDVLWVALLFSGGWARRQKFPIK